MLFPLRLWILWKLNIECHCLATIGFGLCIVNYVPRKKRPESMYLWLGFCAMVPESRLWIDDDCPSTSDLI